MTVEQKLRFYQMLVDIGFRQIEIGYPAASKIERRFARELIENGLISNGIKPQVLVAAREDLIRGTFDAMKGAPETIVHVYNSTSELQRRVVYNMSKDDTIRRAVQATKLVRELSVRTDTPVQYQYSPESFTGTELEFARDICNAVIDAWKPTSDNPIIINLPATVEMTSPNVYADQIEWMSRNLNHRENVIISVHPHNDRGTGVAAAELALQAGADRIEGTLFGNGERAGNVDIVVLALNLYTQGINPMLDFRDIPQIREVYEQCTGLVVPDRHPYAGDAAPIAYSGTHQIAIRRTLEERKKSGQRLWDVAYLPINYAEIGRSYTPIVINSQSGKNGTAFVLQDQFGVQVPKEMEAEVGKVVQEWCEHMQCPISPDKIKELFDGEFVNRSGVIHLRGFSHATKEDGAHRCEATLDLTINGREISVEGRGNGPIDAAVDALASIGQPVQVDSFSEHSLNAGSDASAMAYVKVTRDGISCYGAGIDTSSELAAIRALVSAVNRIAA
jgi:2-isopropylmalate synthase